MTPVESLFELQSSAPGLPGPYLVENLASYRVLDKMGQKKPRVMLALGGVHKRQHMSSTYFEYGYPKEHSIGIAHVGHNTLVLDGELHLKEHNHLPRFQEKRPFGGGCHAHLLEQGLSRAGSIAYQIYANVLSPLSDIILIFIPDFGLQDAVKMLCSWAKSAMGTGFHVASRVVLLHDTIPADVEIKNQLLASFASELRKSDPFRSYTSADTQSIINKTFHITSVSLADCTWRAHVEEELKAARACRIELGMEFAAHQLKYLLRGAVQQHARDPLVPLDIIHSLKQQHSPDSNYSDALRDFLHIHQPISDMEAGIVASAFNLDAHPPGIPCQWVQGPSRNDAANRI
ncbi:patatin-like serine hydrolase [Fusarium beomiforme]|uniref:Patatin-like serine hydrolase n=1 Tax=Fusarium beomiforme TaxID=44412 RepID=A0A9P5ASE2_9HYPO|nr:patatin-like serine hydrolase [Fusarium beomiforme]